MRIGIISDTHGTLPDSAIHVLSDCDVVLHAGDIGSQKVLDMLKSGIPDADVYPVLGNCDDVDGVRFDQDIPKQDKMIFDDVAFLLTHKPADARNMISDFQFSPLYDVVGDIVSVHGHTHVPDIRDISDREIIVCPGALNDPRDDWQRTIAKIDVADRRVIGTQIVSLTGKVIFETKSWI